MTLHIDNGGRRIGLPTLAAKCPAIFAERPHESRSERYVHVPTAPVLSTLSRMGFDPYAVSVATVRKRDREGFQKHLVRLRHVSNETGNRGGVPELVLINSHDGGSAYHMLAGWFEFLCANGLVIGDEIGAYRVMHKGTVTAVLKSVEDGAREMMENMRQIAKKRARMLGTALEAVDQDVFARKALALRFGDIKPPVKVAQILEPRRREEGRDLNFHGAQRPRGNLWTTYQVVQENLIRGGMDGTAPSGRRRRQRPLAAIAANTTLNKRLWTLAEETVTALAA